MRKLPKQKEPKTDGLKSMMKIDKPTHVAKKSRPNKKASTSPAPPDPEPETPKPPRKATKAEREVARKENERHEAERTANGGETASEKALRLADTEKKGRGQYGDGEVINPKYPGGVMMQLIMEGKNNDQVWKETKERFPDLPDTKRGYISWCRSYLKRYGKI